MLTITFLGVGSAYAKRNFQSNALLEAWSTVPEKQAQPDDTLLIDFGATGPLALYHLKGQPGFAYLDCAGLVNYPVIRRVLITHLHSDHVGGLEELAGANIHCHASAAPDRPVRPQLISSPELVENLWEHSLKGGLGVLCGREAVLEDYFAVLPVSPLRAPCDAGRGSDLNALLVGERYRVSPFLTDHIHLRNRFDWPSLGLLIEDGATGRSAFFSGDTRFDPDRFVRPMQEADVVFHEVQLDEEPSGCSAPSERPDPPREPVHALLSQLRTLPEAIRRKTFLYHYGDMFDCGAYDFVADEFAGFAVAQRRYVLFAD